MLKELICNFNYRLPPWWAVTGLAKKKYVRYYQGNDIELLSYYECACVHKSQGRDKARRF